MPIIAKRSNHFHLNNLTKISLTVGIISISYYLINQFLPEDSGNFYNFQVATMSHNNPQPHLPHDKNHHKKPSLVVFDLDYTLWPFWVDTHVTPPFSIKGSKIVDAHGQTVKHYPEVTEVLEYLKNEGIKIAIASRTSEIQGANQLVKLFGWDKYFHHREIYPGCKLNHFKVFARQTGHSYESMMFFDDEERNIRDLSGVGVHCVFVKKGVTMALVKEALQKFATKNQ